MGRMKELWQEQQDMAEPCPSDFKTKKEMNEFFKPKKKQKQWDGMLYPHPKSLGIDSSVPMSINSIGDNADAWLDDEPWRKW